MKEIRMTFGEHLEELRRRILWALLWLSIAVVVSFVYGKGLLRWTMGPHEIAIRGAVRDRCASILFTKGKELLALSGEEGLGKSEGALTPRPPPSTAWDVLFAEEVLRARLSARLKDRLGDWARKVEFPGLEGDRREQFRALFEQFADELSGALAEVMGSEGKASSFRSLPERFFLMEKDLLRISERIGANPVKRLFGFGKNLKEAIAPFQEFNRFLESRRKAIIEAGTVRTSVDPATADIIQKLEAVFEDMRVQGRILEEDEAKPPIAISYLESFMTYFKVALVFGLFFSTPLILYEMWKFIGAGLYPNEQRYVLIFLPFSLALFFGGAIFGYLSVIPVALQFLASWGADIVDLNFTISSYVGLFFTLTIILGLVFQTPLVMIFLGKVGFVSPAGFRKFRKWMILASVAFAAVVTPPDPLSWSLVAIPMILLYEFGILLVAWMSRPKSKDAAQGPREPEEKPQGVSV